MADINEIVSQKAITNLEKTNAEVLKLAETLLQTANAAKVFDASLSKIASSNDNAAEKARKLNEAEKEQAKAAKDLQKQREQAERAIAKQLQKEAEFEHAIKNQAKAIAELEKQNKALRHERDRVDTSTEAGRKKIDEFNKKINENTERIRLNTDAATKQRMNIGNYKSALEGLPGALGGASRGVIGFSNTMKTAAAANPLLLVVMLIIQGLDQLKKLFAGTGTGAEKMAATFKVISDTIKIVVDRLRDFIGGIGELLKGNFREGIDKMGMAFKGVGDQIRNATRAAYEYEEAMGKINDSNHLMISEIAEMELQIAKYMHISKDMTKTDEQRKNALEAAFALERKIMEFKKSQAIETYKEEIKYIAAKAGVEEEYIKLMVEGSTETVKFLESQPGLWHKIWEEHEDALKKAEELYATVFASEKEYFEGTLRMQSQLTRFQEEMHKEAMQREKDRREANMMGDVAAAKKYSDLESFRTQTYAGKLEMRLEYTRQFNEAMDGMEATRSEKMQRLLDDWNANYQQYLTGIVQMAQAVHAFTTQLYDNEISKIEQQKAYELELAGDNAQRKEAIEKKYAKQVGAVRARQARLDRSMAIFQIAIQTALNVVKSFSLVPLMLFAAALGALSIAAVAAKPIPAYRRGTRSARRGIAQVGEAGRELVIGPDGSISLTGNRAHLMRLRGGEQIIPNQQTEMILRAARSGADGREMRRMVDSINAGNRELVEVVRNKRELHLSPDGRKITERKGHYFRNYMNKKVLN